ncbi:hypothetical protein ACET6M_19245 [Aeromonas veronii]
MSVEKELREYLHAVLKGLDTKSRDINLILYCYGFGKDLWPTLENAADEFNVGSSEGRRSERPRQIINSKFKKIAKLSEFPLLMGFSQYLHSSSIHYYEDLIRYVEENNLFDGNINLLSLLWLLNDLDDAKEYKAYTIGLDDLTKSGYNKGTEVIFGVASKINTLKTSLKKAKTIPGQLGIAKLQYLMDEVNLNDLEFQILLNIIKSDPDSWFYSDSGYEYYLFESRDNTLINNLEKIKNITKLEDVDILAKVLVNSLNRRTAPNKREYPPENVIKRYLLSSKHTEIRGNKVYINVEPVELTNIEKDISNYLINSNVNDYPTISNHLLTLGYEKPLIDKTVFYSPLLFVDKSQGRYHYTYNLVGKSSDSAEVSTKYEDFRQRLIKASEGGTDGSSNILTRKEHHILSLWLFEGKEKEFCAICQKEFSVKSLVTAHKKKRKDCAENERTDPYIVMPLCVFGCDYLYENRLIYIDSGIVHKTNDSEHTYITELDYIKSISGNKLEERWLKGNELYFPKPNNKKQSDV